MAASLVSKKLSAGDAGKDSASLASQSIDERSQAPPLKVSSRATSEEHSSDEQGTTSMTSYTDFLQGPSRLYHLTILCIVEKLLHANIKVCWQLCRNRTQLPDLRISRDRFSYAKNSFLSVFRKEFRSCKNDSPYLVIDGRRKREVLVMNT